MKTLLFRCAGTAAFARFVDVLERAPDRRANLLRVLTYHRVDDPAARPDLSPAALSATPDCFARQMEHLARRYRVVSLADVLDAHRGGRPLPPRAALVTFDDAYRDFAEHAWPTLRRCGLPATMFVATAYPDRPDRSFWWDRLHRAVGRAEGRRLAAELGAKPFAELLAAVDRLCEERGVPAAAPSVLGWDELRRLASEGLTLAAHTRTHPLMSRVPVEEAVREATGSREDLEREVGPTPPAFAYPGGAWSDAVAAALRQAEFDLAFTTRRGMNRLPAAEPMALRRINVGGRTTVPLLAAQLAAPARHLSRGRNPAA